MNNEFDTNENGLYPDSNGTSGDNGFGAPMNSDGLNPGQAYADNANRTFGNPDVRMEPQFSSYGYSQPTYRQQFQSGNQPYVNANQQYGHGANPYGQQYSQPTDNRQMNGGYFGAGQQQGTPDFTENPKKKKKEKRAASKGFVVGMMIIAMVFCLLLGAAFSAFLYEQAEKEGKTVISGGDVVVVYESESEKDPVVDKGDAAYVASVAADSVVEITTEQVEKDTYFGQYVTQHAGSGVIISSGDGGTYIITCAHVIDGSDKVTVTLKNGKQYEATFSAGDTLTDIGIVKIDVNGLKPATVADFSKVTVGENVVAIGNPLGSLGGSVTKGVVSALDRDIMIDGTSYHLLQTDTAVNPGNSGGGLFNAEGKLIGIVNAKSAEENIEGIGFAIPIDNAMKIATELIENGYVTGRVKLGVELLEITSQQDIMYYYQYAKYFTQYGVYIINSEDEQLQRGDRIIALDSITVDSIASLRTMLLDYKVGDTVELTISRLNGRGKDEMKNIRIVLKEMTN